MEINKQLFEDILSGKLKGTFVLRDKQIVKSNTLKRTYSSTFPYEILIKYDNQTTDYGTYKSNGNFDINTSCFDIIDFILDTNMKENELTIEIPEGKIVDWDESKKQNKIVLKDQLTYEDVCKKLFKNKEIFYATLNGDIISIPSYVADDLVYNRNSTISKHQLECILAKNKLANVAKYLNDGWKPIKTDLGHFDAFVLFMTPDKDYIGCVRMSNCAYNSNVLFKSEELAQQAIEILGEETIELALEPLGI